MRISEIFYSIQGEGLGQGFPTVFVRTQGCSVGCKNCIAEGMLITKSDGSCTPIENIIPGDKILGVEGVVHRDRWMKDLPEAAGLRPKFVEATVLEVHDNGIKSLYNLNGLVATGDHRILDRTYRARWKLLKNFQEGQSVVQIPMREAWDSKSWLAGYFDGDGSFYSQKTNCGGLQCKCKAASKDEQLTLIAFEAMKANGFNPRVVRHNGGNGILSAVEITKSHEAEAFEDFINTHRAGPSYFGGFFDAEGTFDGGVIKLAQKTEPTRAYILERLKREDIPYRLYGDATIHLALGTQYNQLKFLMVKGSRLTRKFYNIFGRSTECKAPVTEIRDLESQGRVFDLTTSTGNFFASGLLVHNCDTKYSWHAKSGFEMALGTIMLECDRVGGGCKRLCLTGGEPLEQLAETEGLVKLASRVYGYDVEVETSGCVEMPSQERWPCRWIVDIKTPSTGASDKNMGYNLKGLNYVYGDCAVAVIRDKVDFDYACDFASRWLSGPCNLYFHPDGSVEDLQGLMKDIATWLKKEHSAKNWRMGYQLHRLIWGAQIGV